MYRIGRYEIRIPPNFSLPRFQERYQQYDRFLPILVEHLPIADNSKLLVDVGANVGDTAVALIQHCRNPIICIEPSDVFFHYLEENVNSLPQPDSGRVIMRKLFIGTGRFNGALAHSEGGTAGIVVSTVGDSISTCIELDRVIDDKSSVVLLKVDTDGFDFDVIKSAETILYESKPILFWENFMTEDFQYEGFEELYGFLSKIGYSNIYIFDNFGGLLLRCHDFEMLRCINQYIYGMDRHNCPMTFYYTDILAATDKYAMVLRNAVDDYQQKWLKN